MSEIPTVSSRMRKPNVPAVPGSIRRRNVGPTNLPIFLLHNVVFSNGSQCCILGYHNAYGSPTQVYGVGDYDTTQNFPSAVDVSVLAHEVGEAISPVLTVPGGIPIRVGDRVVAGIGVAGADADTCRQPAEAVAQ